MPLVQKFIVEDVDKASPLLPQHIALVNADGTNFIAAATTTKAGVVKKAPAVAPAAEGADAAALTTTVNAVIANLKAAGIMA